MVAVGIVVVALFTFPAAADGAAPPTESVLTPTNPWYSQRVSDSLAKLTADASVLEPTIQNILDDLGTGLNAVTDLLPNEFFYTLSGCTFIEIVAEYSSDANVNTISWYDPGHTAVVHEILPGNAGPGDTAYLALEGADSIALRLYHPPYANWYSEVAFNFDGKPHVKFYPTADPQAFLMFWEDLPYLSDADFNDMVAILHLPAGIPTITCTPPQTVVFCDSTVVCVAFTATLEGADSVEVVIMFDGQIETRVVASGVADSICLPVTQPDEYAVAIMPVDACGLGEVCASGFIAIANSPPSISVRDTSLFLCDFEWICVPYEISDPDGNDGLVVSIVSGSGSVDSVHRIILISGSAGTKTTIVRVTDPCGATADDTLTVVVTRNLPPTIVVGDGAPAFQCEPGEFCIDYTVSDPDGLAGLIEEIISGPPGTTIDTALNRICFLPDTSGTYGIIVQVTDTCGASGRDTSTVIVTANDPPTIVLGNDTTVNQCAAAPICVAYAVSDPDGLDGLTEIKVTGPGAIDTAANTICFVPDASGTYTIVAQVSDPCQETDVDTILVHVNLNTPPALVLDDDFSAFLCAPEAICVGYAVSDQDGMAGLTEALIAYPDGATIDTIADQVCFTPAATGLYTIVAAVTDSCDITDIDTIQVDVTINSAPTISLNNGAPAFQCEPGELCFPYEVADDDGLAGLIEVLLVGPGSIDTLNNRICFTPDTTGTYTLVAQVTDSCGAFDTDTISVYAETNGPPTIAFGADAEISQCLPALICVPYDVDDPNGLAGLTELLLAGTGTFDTVGNQICFVPDASGDYTFIAAVNDPCGETDVDTIVISVTLNRPPTIAFGDQPVEVFLCAPEELCIPYAVDDPDGLAGLTEMIPVDADPPGGGGGDGDLTALSVDGAYIDTVANLVCFLPTTSGTYCLTVAVRDTCGAGDTDTICITVTFNSPPTISLGDDDAVVLCAPEEVCLPYTVADVDGTEGLIAEVLPGPPGATIDPDNNLVCFTPDTTGVYTIIARVTDDCDAFDMDTMLVTVTLNQAPTIALDEDISVFLCLPEPVCVGYTATDPDAGDVLTETLISGPGAIDTVGNTVCFTPGAPGVYTLIVRVTDACGLSDEDTVVVTVTLNRDPVFTFEPNLSVLLCGPEAVCVDYTVSDPDGPDGLVETQVAVPPGTTFDTLTNTVCFTPDTSGTYRIIGAVKDSCVQIAVDTVLVTVDFNVDPVVAFGTDLTVFQCATAPVCIGYTVIDSNAADRVTETLLLGAPWATIDTTANAVCFTPAGTGTYEFIVAVSDSCGGFDSDTIDVTVGANRPPVLQIAGDQSILACAASELCIQAAGVSDPDGNLDTMYVSSGSGTIDPITGELCFTVDTAGTYCFDITAVDSCEAEDVGSICITVTLNDPPTITLGTVPGDLHFQEPTQLCLPIHATDPNAGQQFEVTMLTGAGTFVPALGRNVLDRSHCFVADTTGCYEFVFAVTDSCGAFDEDTAVVCVDITPPDTVFQVCIDTIRALNGQLVDVHIKGIQMMEMGGFDFLVCYDQTALGFANAQPESTLTYWEYFTFRTGVSAGCFTCPGGVLRMLAFADVDNGVPIPDGAFFPKGNMIKLSFFVTSDRTFINHCAPIRFCWEDCGDNTISSRSGDTTYLAIDGVADSCLDGDKVGVQAKIIFCDGAVCIDPPPDDRGDINLNGIAYEVGDAVLYTNFFIYGHSVWDPVYKESQILASDCNCDGQVLTIADLITLIRVLTNDIEPIDCPDGQPKAAAALWAADIILQRTGDQLDVSVNSEIDLGGVFVALSSTGGAFGDVNWAEQPAGLKTEAQVSGAELRAVIVPNESGAGLPAGRRLLFSVPLPADAELRVDETQAASHDGEVVATVAIEAGADRPSAYSLDQNYPNPFNAGTVLRFSLGEAQDWELTVYNILGQTVRRFSGYSAAGSATVFWDGTADDGRIAGTGVYFARLQAGQFAATRKMVMIK